ncbi:MAG: cytochrome c [Chitinophagaceae bacterium]|nr:MAG: cytochrome c [Chitinophagaceae bacterium]
MKKIAGLLFILTGALSLFAFQMNPKAPSKTIDRGKIVYNNYCLSCHMPNGEGVPRMTPSLSKSKYVLGQKPNLIEIILLGSEALANEPNRTFKNLMAPLDNLTDLEIADALNYVRNSFGNKTTFIYSKEVKSVRLKVGI